MGKKSGTPFVQVYDDFLSCITDDLFLELSELDTYRVLEELLMSAIHKFEFPRVDLDDYTIEYFKDQDTYQGVESDDHEVPALLYTEGHFNHKLSHEEIHILAIYMVVEWLGYQLASIENTRMKYSGTDFKFSSQASHMQKLLSIKKDYEREGFHLQRLYKRRIKDENGIYRSTMGTLRDTTVYTQKSSNNNEDCKEVEEHCDKTAKKIVKYVDTVLTWQDF